MKTILVVDDSKTIRSAASSMLKKEGYTVVTADDGLDAIIKITDNSPDLIFVDILMPKLDGYQTCSLVKKNQAFKEIPVIMISSKDGLFDRARGSVVGAQGHINKPFSGKDLIDIIKKFV